MRNQRKMTSETPRARPIENHSRLDGVVTAKFMSQFSAQPSIADLTKAGDFVF